MEVVQGKSNNKKIVIAQEIAFAKVLAGNNKTLRDRAIKKLKKWLMIRGTGKWEFTEEEFIRIWTGLFYCMWMSDKFLIQEELAECISKLIHCFKKNSKGALLFIKCFHKRILMDWEGLDQYRIDKFNMLIRRFLRQTFVYCKEKDWEESLLNKLTDIFYNVVLHQDSSLGFVLHFISIYLEELTKVGDGKLESKTVLKLIEPFIKLLARSKDFRIHREIEEFFNYLMQQTDTGIEFEERLNAWKEQGCPGEGPHCMKRLEVTNGEHMPIENGNDSFSEDEEDLNSESKPLDPRAGSVHVFLPQLPLDVDGLINLFKKYQNAQHTYSKGRKLLKSLTQKFEGLKRGRFPVKIKKNPILLETKKKKRTRKNAKELMKFTEQIDEAPIRTKEFKDLVKELEDEDDQLEEEDSLDEQVEGTDEDLESVKEHESLDEFDEENETDDEKVDEEEQQLQLNLTNKNNKKASKNRKLEKSIINVGETKIAKKRKNMVVQDKKSGQNIILKENLVKKKKKKKSTQVKQGKNTKQILANADISVMPKKKLVNGVISEMQGYSKRDFRKVTPVPKTGMKRKILSNWQIQELDTNSPEYFKIETPKVITIERKIEETSFLKENEPVSITAEKDGSEVNAGSAVKVKEEFIPIFWEKAKAKANRQSGIKSKVFVNPFVECGEESRTPNRRISFALERNMAQENEEYLEEVKNSPRVPFDGSKKPIQSALKSGLAPSPVNPFYRFKKIKL